jgi:hypothetical protein
MMRKPRAPAMLWGSAEMIRAGYDACAAGQDAPWCMHQKQIPPKR